MIILTYKTKHQAYQLFNIFHNDCENIPCIYNIYIFITVHMHEI